MGQTTPIRSDELLRQLEHLYHTVQDPSLLLWLQRSLKATMKLDELPWYRISGMPSAWSVPCTQALRINTCQINDKCLCQRDLGTGQIFC